MTADGALAPPPETLGVLSFGCTGKSLHAARATTAVSQRPVRAADARTTEWRDVAPVTAEARDSLYMLESPITLRLGGAGPTVRRAGQKCVAWR
jgi:hypothetical protein